MTVAQLLLAWVIRHPGVLAIPKAASIEHVVQNAAALDIVPQCGRARAAGSPLSATAAKNPAGYGLISTSASGEKAPSGTGLLLLAFFQADGLRQARGVSSLAFCGWVTQQVSTQTKVL